VGYGPNPNECVETVRSLYPLWIAVGNYDWAACGLKDITWFNEYSQKSLIWTRRQLTEQNQIYLSELPKMMVHSCFTIVHGSLRDPLGEYIFTHQQYQENAPLLKTTYTFVGHSHIPFVFASSGVHIFRSSEDLSLERDDKYIINPGSVGQPRDGDPRASCAVIDTTTKWINLYRVEYDVQKTQEKMRAARLPGFLIERLSWGR